MKNFFGDLKHSLILIVSDQSISQQTQKMILGLILLTCLVVRLYTIDAPQLDRTCWKEIDYIEISRNYWKHGYNFFHPEITWPAEPPRYTAIELPLVPYAAALLYSFVGFNVYSVRLITLLSFLFLLVYIFRLAKRELGPLVGLLAALATGIMPLYHPFGRILFSEPLMIAMSVLALYHFAEWVDFKRRIDWLLALVGFSLAVGLKLEPLYLLLPLLWIAFRKYKFQIKLYRGFIFFVICSLILPLAWYSYAFYLKQSSMDVFGIFGGHNKLQSFTMLSDPAWYRTMYGRIMWNILGGKIGIGLLLSGLCTAILIRKGGLFFFYLLSIGCYFAIVAEGQIDAPYRQLTIIPPLSVFVAIGAIAILSSGIICIRFLTRFSIPEGRQKAICIVGCVLIISMIGVKKQGEIFAWNPMAPGHPDKWKLGLELKKHTTRDSKLAVVGEYTIHVGGNDLSPVLYYYSGLQGWTLQKGDWNLPHIDALVEKGATHFAAIATRREPESAPFLSEMKMRYKVLCDNRDRDELLLDLGQFANR